MFFLHKCNVVSDLLNAMTLATMDVRGPPRSQPEREKSFGVVSSWAFCKKSRSLPWIRLLASYCSYSFFAFSLAARSRRAFSSYALSFSFLRSFSSFAFLASSYATKSMISEFIVVDLPPLPSLSFSTPLLLALSISSQFLHFWARPLQTL